MSKVSFRRKQLGLQLITRALRLGGESYNTFEQPKQELLENCTHSATIETSAAKVFPQGKRKKIPRLLVTLRKSHSHEKALAAHSATPVPYEAQAAAQRFPGYARHCTEH